LSVSIDSDEALSVMPVDLCSSATGDRRKPAGAGREVFTAL
jgi:hypothetical protein